MKMRVETNVAIPLRDGVKLSADVFVPDDGEAHPTLLHVPYRGRRSRSSIAQILNPFHAAERGYGLVLVDNRGTSGSEGDWEPFRKYADDGYDMVEWIATQDWCDGNVGMYGNSGMGAATALTAMAAPPHLKAVMLVFTGANYYDGWAYTSGVFELGFSVHWQRGHIANLVGRMPDGPDKDALRTSLLHAAHNEWEDISRLPLGSPDERFDTLAPWYPEWLEHPSYDDYWNEVDAVAHASKIDVPVLQIGCWYDLFLPSQLELDRALAEQPADSVGSTTRLIVGPWAHNTYLGLRSTVAGDRNFGLTADCSAAFTMPLAFRWFDAYLRDGASPEMPRARYYVMGSNEWRDAESWPPAAAQPLELFLHSGGRANSRFGDGVLAEAKPGVLPPDGFRYDPMNPVISHGGPTIQQDLTPDGVQDQSKVEEREDVLVYTSAPVSGLTIAGHVSVILHAATSAVDTDFTAKLVDVEPGGYCANVCEGIVRARYRKGTTEEQLVEPGAVEEYEIKLNDVAYHFAPGHQIRLEISSSNFPRFARNLNCVTNPNQATAEEAVVAVQTVYHDGTRPSRLVLPALGG
jgi:putative CocE/NonD family hydrolase